MKQHFSDPFLVEVLILEAPVHTRSFRDPSLTDIDNNRWKLNLRSIAITLFSIEMDEQLI